MPSLKFRSQKAKWRLQDAKAQADLETFCEVYRPLSESRNVQREQLLIRVHELYGYEVLRKGCCAGMSLDKGGLSLLFSQGKATPEAHTLEGLRSFLRDVEQHSGGILFVF